MKSSPATSLPDAWRTVYHRHLDAWHFLALLILGFLLYQGPLHSTYFHFDDKVAIERNPAIQNGLDLPLLWNAFNSRVAVGTSFAANFALGGLDPYGYRVVNLFLHIFMSFGVYLLARLLLNRAAEDKRFPAENVPAAAFSAALIFLVHPVHTEPVNFICQRFVLMASYLYLSSVYLYLRWRDTGKLPYALGAWGAALLAMFSKEFTVTLPFMVLLAEIAWVNARKETVIRRGLRVLPFLLLLPVIPLTLMRTDHQMNSTARIAAMAPASQDIAARSVDITRAGGWELGRTEYFLTELNVIRTYLRLLFCPVRQNIDYDYPITRSLADPPTLMSGLLLLILGASGIMLFKSARLVAFGILWFFLALSVESSVIPIGHVIAEYRLYLPSVGFCLLIVSLLWSRPVQKHGQTLTAVFICFLSVLTFLRNDIWKDQTRLWEDTMRKSPRKSRPYVNLGACYMNRLQYDKAVPYFQKAIQLDPKMHRAYDNLSFIYAYGKDPDIAQALSYASTAYTLDPWEKDYVRQMGYLTFKNGDLGKALVYYQELVSLEPSARNLEEFGKLVFIYFQRTGDKERTLQLNDWYRARGGDPAFAGYIEHTIRQGLPNAPIPESGPSR